MKLNSHAVTNQALMDEFKKGIYKTDCLHEAIKQGFMG